MPATVEDWEASLNNAHAQLEHQRLRSVMFSALLGSGSDACLFRLTNLELMQKYGSNSWRIHNFTLEVTAKNLDKAVEDLKQLTVEVNRDRKNFQVRPEYQSTEIMTVDPRPQIRPVWEHNSPLWKRNGPSSSPACSKLRWQMLHSRSNSTDLARKRWNWQVYNYSVPEGSHQLYFATSPSYVQSMPRYMRARGRRPGHVRLGLFPCSSHREHQMHHIT